MASLLDLFRSRKPREQQEKETKCACGGALIIMSCGKKDVYFCRDCNKMIYFLESELETPKIIPISLGWLKKK